MSVSYSLLRNVDRTNSWTYTALPLVLLLYYLLERKIQLVLGLALKT